MSSASWPALKLSLFGTKIAKHSESTEHVRPAAIGVPCGVSANFPKAWPLSRSPRSPSPSQPRMGRGPGDNEAVLSEDPRVHRRTGGGAGRLAGEPCAAHRTRGTVGQGQGEGYGQGWLSGRPWRLSQPGLFHLWKKRGSESKQEESTTTRGPPTGRNGRFCKITAAEGSEEWQVDRQDRWSHFRAAQRYYLENNKEAPQFLRSSTPTPCSLYPSRPCLRCQDFAGGSGATGCQGQENKIFFSLFNAIIFS